MDQSADERSRVLAGLPQPLSRGSARIHRASRGRRTTASRKRQRPGRYPRRLHRRPRLGGDRRAARAPADPATIFTGAVSWWATSGAAPSTKNDDPEDYTGRRRWKVLYPDNMVSRRGPSRRGAFDERFQHAAEDNDLCYRWLTPGRRLDYRPALVSSTTTGEAGGAAGLYRAMAREGPVLRQASARRVPRIPSRSSRATSRSSHAATSPS